MCALCARCSNLILFNIRTVSSGRSSSFSSYVAVFNQVLDLFLLYFFLPSSCGALFLQFLNKRLSSSIVYTSTHA